MVRNYSNNNKMKEPRIIIIMACEECSERLMQNREDDYDRAEVQLGFSDLRMPLPASPVRHQALSGPSQQLGV